MAEINVITPPAFSPPTPPPGKFSTLYVVFCWGGRQGYSSQDMIGNRQWQMWTGLNSGVVLIPVDPLTAISNGWVTPEQLGYPPGILAAFNLLSKET